MSVDDAVGWALGFMIAVFALFIAGLLIFGSIEAVQEYRTRYVQLACRVVGREPVRAVLSDSVVCAARIGGLDSLNVRLETKP